MDSRCRTVRARWRAMSTFKMIKRQMYGRASFDLHKRILHAGRREGRTQSRNTGQNRNKLLETTSPTAKPSTTLFTLSTPSDPPNASSSRPDPQLLTIALLGRRRCLHGGETGDLDDFRAGQAVAVPLNSRWWPQILKIKLSGRRGLGRLEVS